MSPPLRSFGEFELDADRYELRRSGRPLKLERIPMELLILLAEGDGRMVTRQAIVERLWGKDVHVDTEHGINTAVRKIRTALREDAERPRFIQTVQGKGYRFVADGANGRNAGAAAPLFATPAAPASASPEPAAVASPAGRPRLWGLALTLVIMLAGALVALDVGGIRDRLSGGHPRARMQSIAVLPFVNLSGDASQDYFADGMTDELITMLARRSSLRVVSRTSAMQYKGARRPVREIGRELGVDGILEGSVEKSDKRVHLTVQLIDVAADSHLWAQSYDRNLGDALSLPSELSKAVAAEVRLAASPAASPRAIDPEAHDSYLRGRYFWFANNYDRAQEYLEKALGIEPDYPAAWSGLADTYTVRAVAVMAPPQEVMPRAKAAALKALALDGNAAEAHHAMAAVRLFGDWDVKAADDEARRTLELDPSDAEVRHLRAHILFAGSRFDEALEEQRRSSEMDPFARPWALGQALIRARRFEAALDELRLRAEAQPQDRLVRHHLFLVYWHLGRWRESFEELEKNLRAGGDRTGAEAAQHAFEARGRQGMAEWLLARTRDRAREAYVSPWALASAWARLDRKEETLRFLEDAYREHCALMVFLQAEPLFDFLHSDERYRALVAKVGLPPAY